MNSPQAPDPFSSSIMQQQFNQQAAADSQRMSMVSQTNPFGSLDYTKDTNSPSGYRATTALTPAQQGILDEQNAIRFGMGGVGKNVLASGAGALSGQPIDLSFGATEANLDRLNRMRLDPIFNDRAAQLDQKLADQGLQPGSAGYDEQMRDFNTARNDAYNSMLLAGHGQAVSDITQQYDSPLNVLSALQTGSQVQTPNSSFISTPQAHVDPVNYMGAVNQNYQNKLAQSNAAMGGMFGLGGSLISGAGSYFGIGGLTTTPQALRNYNGQAEWAQPYSY